MKTRIFTNLDALDRYFRTIPIKMRNMAAEYAWDLAVAALEKSGQIKFGWARSNEANRAWFELAEPVMKGGELCYWTTIPTYMPAPAPKLTKRQKHDKKVANKVEETARIMMAAVDILKAYRADQINKKNGTPTQGARNTKAMHEDALGVKFPGICELKKNVEKFYWKACWAE